jgi:hypothetical protein
VRNGLSVALGRGGGACGGAPPEGNILREHAHEHMVWSIGIHVVKSFDVKQPQPATL